MSFQCSVEFSLPNGTCYGNNGPCASAVNIWASTDTTDGQDPTQLPPSMTAVPSWGKVTFQDPVKNWGGPIQNNQLDYLIFWLPSSGCTPLTGQPQSCTSSGGFVYDNPSIESADHYPCGISTACSTIASDTNYENLIVQYFGDVGGSSYYHSIVDQYGAGCCPHLGAEQPPAGYIGGPGWVVDNTTSFPTGNSYTDSGGTHLGILYISNIQQEISYWQQHYFNGSLEGNPGNINTEFFIFLPYNVYGCYGISLPSGPIGCSFDTSYQSNTGLGNCSNSCSNAFHSFIPSSCNSYISSICSNIKTGLGPGNFDGTELPFSIFFDQGTTYGFAQSMLQPACQGLQIPLGYYINGSATCNVNLLNNTPNGSFFADSLIPSIAHEQFETITNPLPFGFAFSSQGTRFQSDIAWDQSTIGSWPGFPDITSLNGAFLGEIGDLCKPSAQADGPDSSVLDQVGLDFANVILSGHKYLVYDIWSNSAGGCTLGPPAGSPQASVSAGTVTPNPVVAGNDVSFYVGIQSINGLSGHVNVTAGIASGRLRGTDPTVSPTSLSVLLSSGSRTRFLLTLSTGPLTTPGFYTVQIDAVTLADSGNPGAAAWTLVVVAVTEPTCTGTHTGICVVNPFSYVVTNSGKVPGSTVLGSPGVGQVEALCRSGDFPTGGGYDTGSLLIANASMPIISYGPIPMPSGWSVGFVNNGSTSETGTAFVVCMSSPILSTYSRSKSISIPPPSVNQFSSVGVSVAMCDTGDFSTGGGFKASGDISQSTLAPTWSTTSSTPFLENSEPVGWSAEFQNLGAGGGTGTSLRAASFTTCVHTTYSLSTYSRSIAQTVYSGFNPRSVSICGAPDFATGGGFNLTSTAFDSVTAPRTLSQDLQLPVGWNSEVVIPAGYSTIAASVVCMRPIYEPGSSVSLSCGIAPLLAGSETKCEATVTSTGPRASLILAPTGNVSFDSSGGTFTPSSSCNLAGILGSSSCNVYFAPSASSLGDVIIHASYPGDTTFPSGTANATLQEFDYSLVLTPIKKAIPRGDLISYDVSTNLGSGSAGEPASLDLAVAGLPSDAKLSGPSSIELPGTSTLTIQTGTTTLGNYTLTVSASFSEYRCTILHVCSFETGSRSSTTTLQIYDFSLASSGSITTSSSVAGVSIISITSQNGFDGAVTLDKSIGASGLTCSLASPTLSNGSGSATLSCSGSPGKYTVTVTAVSGTLSHSIPVSVTVTSIQSTPSAPATSIFGLPLSLFYGIMAALIILATVSVSLALRSRKRPSHPQVAGPAGKPPSE